MYSDDFQYYDSFHNSPELVKNVNNNKRVKRICMFFVILRFTWSGVKRPKRGKKEYLPLPDE